MNQYLPDEILLQVIMNSDICTLVDLYYTNKRYRNIIENNFILLSEKYYTKIKNIKDLEKECLYTILVPEYGESKYVEGELLRAVQKIKHRYYNDGDRIDHCTWNRYNKQYHKTVCNCRDFLIKYGFEEYINMVHQYNYKEWIILLENAVINKVLSKNGHYQLLPIGESCITYQILQEDEEVGDDDSDSW